MHVRLFTDMTIFLNFPMVTLGGCPGCGQTVSYELQTKCKAPHALLHVISLVDWPKHVKSFFKGTVDSQGDLSIAMTPRLAWLLSPTAA